jgi:hypothetical protein
VRKSKEDRADQKSCGIWIKNTYWHPSSILKKGASKSFSLQLGPDVRCVRMPSLHNGLGNGNDDGVDDDDEDEEDGDDDGGFRDHSKIYIAFKFNAIKERP